MKRASILLLLIVSAIGTTLPLGLKSSANDDGASPRVVARISRTLRAADLPTTTTLYTPEESGLFRINGYAVVTNSDPSGRFIGYFSFGWTDDVSTKAQQQVYANSGNLTLSSFDVSRFFGLVDFYRGGYTSTSFLIRAAGSTPITFSAANAIVPGIPGNNEFTVFFSIEKLSN
jgi:hypothetical protein